jgi:hypothetical protein
MNINKSQVDFGTNESNLTAFTNLQASQQNL